MASTGAGASAATVTVDAAAVSDAATVCSATGVDAASSAQTIAEPPKSAPDRLSAISIFFIRVPQPYFVSYFS